MDMNEIKRLIAAFYNGETSREEERTLRNYFIGNDIADELRDEKELFLQIYENDDLEVPPALERELEKTIDRLARQEQEQIVRRKTLKKLWIRAVSVAAGLALLVSIGLFFNTEDESANNPDTAMAQLSEEEKQKLREAEKALLLLSQNFNKGIEQMTLVSANLNKTKSIISNSINR
jgi:hypothetical protein